jgi:4-phytase/acid phosphatase/peptide/nickel transport system substrate-binding protein
MDRGDRTCWRRTLTTGTRGRPYLDRIVLKPLPDAQSRLQACNGEADIVWDDEADADNIQRAQKDLKLTVHNFGVGSCG